MSTSLTDYFIDAALRFEDALDADPSISLESFVAGEPAERREELRAFLIFNREHGPLGQPDDREPVLPPDVIARANAVIAQATADWITSFAQQG